MSKPLVVSTLKTATGNVSISMDDAGGVTIGTSGAQISLLVSGSNAFQLLNDDMFLFSPSGNVVSTAGQSFQRADEVHQSMLTNDNVALLSPANADYLVVTDAQAPGLAAASRFVVVPAPGGTTIRSMQIAENAANVPGRQISLINGSLGSDPLILTDQDPQGTAGSRFSTPGHGAFSIPAGGGALVSFEPSLGSDGGLWAVVGR